MNKLNQNMTIENAKDSLKNAGLYIVSAQEIKRLADVAMSAYENYPLHNWFSGGKYDKKASKIIMEISIKTMIDSGIIYADSPDLNGFAIWMPPHFSGSKTLPFFLKGGIKLILNSGLGIIEKLLKYENYAMGLKKKYTNHNDWYLYNLSVSKNSQNKGIASKLLYPMLEFCDSNKQICYLETNKDTNVPLYEHFGFELLEEGLIPDTDLKHYAMIKRP